MLIACLRYLALCPYSWCLLLKSRIPIIGTKTDAKQWINLARVDSHHRQKKIELVCRMMFEGGVNITSKRIETILRPTSLVPTWVCCQWSIIILLTLFSHRMHSQKGYSNMTSTFMRCLYQTFSMNLSWVSGRLYSLAPTYFELYMLVGKTKSRHWIHGT
jgi:hypothetical protein